MKKFSSVLLVFLCIGLTVYIFTRPTVSPEKRFSDSLSDYISKYDNYDVLFDQYVKDNSPAYEDLEIELSSFKENISSILSDLYDEYLTINASFDELPDAEAEEKIEAALFNMHDLFDKAGY